MTVPVMDERAACAWIADGLYNERGDIITAAIRARPAPTRYERVPISHLASAFGVTDGVARAAVADLGFLY